MPPPVWNTDGGCAKTIYHANGDLLFASPNIPREKEICQYEPSITLRKAEEKTQKKYAPTKRVGQCPPDR